MKRDGEHVDLVVPGPGTHVDDDALMPLKDDLDDTQARKFVGKRLPSNIRWLTDQRTHFAMYASQIDHSFPNGHASPILVIHDIVSSWRFAIAVNTKSSNEVVKALRRVIGARTTYKVLISDSAPEIALAASVMQLAHVPFTPGRPQQSGHVERSG
eukprot:5544299-Amphidinium_carterae.1